MRRHPAPTKLEGSTADATKLEVGGLAGVSPHGHHLSQDRHFPHQLAKIFKKGCLLKMGVYLKGLPHSAPGPRPP